MEELKVSLHTGDFDKNFPTKFNILKTLAYFSLPIMIFLSYDDANHIWFCHFVYLCLFLPIKPCQSGSGSKKVHFKGKMTHQKKGEIGRDRQSDKARVN